MKDGRAVDIEQRKSYENANIIVETEYKVQNSLVQN
jgi:hypothetical protein